MIEIEIRKKEVKLKEHNLKYYKYGTVLKMESGVRAIVCYANGIVDREYCEDNKCLVVLNCPLDDEICLARETFQSFKAGKYEVMGRIKSGSKLIVE